MVTSEGVLLLSQITILTAISEDFVALADFFIFNIMISCLLLSVTTRPRADKSSSERDAAVRDDPRDQGGEVISLKSFPSALIPPPLFLRSSLSVPPSSVLSSTSIHRLAIVRANYRRSWTNDTVERAGSKSSPQKPMIGKFLLALSEFSKLWKQMCWRLNFSGLSSQAIQWRRRNAKLAFFQSDIPGVRKSGWEIVQKRQIIGLDKVLWPSFAFDAYLTFCISILMHLVRSVCFKPKRDRVHLYFFQLPSVVDNNQSWWML